MRHWSGTLAVDFRSGGRPEEYEGEYQCFARNDLGTALSNKIFLQVSSKYDKVCNFMVYNLIGSIISCPFSTQVLIARIY